MYIWGESSTGKTTIVANPLWHYFGEENIGILSTSKNFQLESLVNKELDLKIIALSNYSINPEDYSEEDLNKKKTDKALANRTEIIKFIKKKEILNLEGITSTDIEKIKKEVPFIMIYCNKILFNKFIKNTGKTKNNLLFLKMSKDYNIVNDCRLINTEYLLK